MILSCSTLLIALFALALCISILLSFRNNVFLLSSSILGIVCSGVFIFLCQRSVIDLGTFINFFSKVFLKLKIDLSVEQVQIFSLLFLTICVFIIVFFLTYLILYKVFSNLKRREKKDRLYFVSKSFLIFINSLFSLFFISVFITFLNIVYNMNEGFLSFIFELVKKGIELL